MAKAKLKTSNKAATAKVKKSTRAADVDDEDEDEVETASVGNDKAPAHLAVDVEDVNFKGEGEKFFHVIKGDHSAIVKADSKGEAKDNFFELFGILSTEEKVRVGEIDEADLSDFQLNEFGVILGTTN